MLPPKRFLKNALIVPLAGLALAGAGEEGCCGCFAGKPFCFSAVWAEAGEPEAGTDVE